MIAATGPSPRSSRLRADRLEAAVVFPGQGSQLPGMRDAVERVSPRLLELVCEAVGADPFERLDEGTRYVQPAIFARSLSSWMELRELVAPVAFAGHSMGEIAALVAAQALGLADGARLIAARGALTAACANGGGMIAVIGLPTETVEHLASRCEAHVANYNAPRQIVVAGDDEALAAISELVTALDGRTIPLQVDGPFHSPAMSSAMPAYAEALASVRFSAPTRPVYSCASGLAFDDPRKQLLTSLVEPVRWVDVVSAMHAGGASGFLEVEPGRVLSGLIKRIVGAEAVCGAAELLEGRTTPEAP